MFQKTGIRPDGGFAKNNVVKTQNQLPTVDQSGFGGCGALGGTGWAGPGARVRLPSSFFLLHLHLAKQPKMLAIEALQLLGGDDVCEFEALRKEGRGGKEGINKRRGKGDSGKEMKRVK